jgi:copper homeostasis protein
MIKEACVESFEEAKQAEKNGANRIELCADLHLDGLTPSFELMKKCCSNLDIPIMVMIRPRAGDFVYSNKEIEQMKLEIDLAKKAGVAGVVFGILTPSNEIDIINTQTLATYAQPLSITFHKAIDELKNPVEGVRLLLKIEGITRILTSGGEITAKEGMQTLREMITASKNKITVLVAGRVSNKNINEIQKLTGSNEFHGKKIVGNLN